MSILQEEFEVWMNGKYQNPFWLGRHRFEKSTTGEIRVDNGLFSRDETIVLFRMLNSRDPFTRLNANFVIWERNRILLILLVIVTTILLVLVITRFER